MCSGGGLQALGAQYTIVIIYGMAEGQETLTVRYAYLQLGNPAICMQVCVAVMYAGNRVQSRQKSVYTILPLPNRDWWPGSQVSMSWL